MHCQRICKLYPMEYFSEGERSKGMMTPNRHPVKFRLLIALLLLYTSSACTPDATEITQPQPPALTAATYQAIVKPSSTPLAAMMTLSPIPETKIPAPTITTTVIGSIIVSSTPTNMVDLDIWMNYGPRSGVVVINALAIDPNRPSILYAGSESDGIYKTLDGGWNWSLINTGLRDTDIHTIAIDPQVLETVYVGTQNGGVFKSTDGGENWVATNNGLINLEVQALAIDPKTPTTIYACTYGGVFKSLDSGDTWSDANDGLTVNHVLSMVIDPLYPDNLYVGTFSGVFKSTDGGTSWKQVGLVNLYVQALAIDTYNPSLIYAGTVGVVADAGGVFVSKDEGVSWQPVGSGIPPGPVFAVAIDQSSCSTLYVGTWDNGVYRSDDSGMTWQAINNGLTSPWIEALLVHPVSSNIIYTGTSGGGIFIIHQRK
jgi:photosystem II stability/assembly factor-like uncharacterized protein